MAYILDDDFHPPDEVRVFSMPASGVRRLDHEPLSAVPLLRPELRPSW